MQLSNKSSIISPPKHHHSVHQHHFGCINPENVCVWRAYVASFGDIYISKDDPRQIGTNYRLCGSDDLSGRFLRNGCKWNRWSPKTRISTSKIKTSSNPAGPKSGFESLFSSSSLYRMQLHTHAIRKGTFALFSPVNYH